MMNVEHLLNAFGQSFGQVEKATIGLAFPNMERMEFHVDVFGKHKKCVKEFLSILKGELVIRVLSPDQASDMQKGVSAWVP